MNGREARASQAPDFAERFDCEPGDRALPGHARILALAAILDATETQPQMPDLESVYWSLERAADAHGIVRGGRVFDAAAEWLGIPYCREAGLYMTPADAAAYRRGIH